MTMNMDALLAIVRNCIAFVNRLNWLPLHALLRYKLSIWYPFTFESTLYMRFTLLDTLTIITNLLSSLSFMEHGFRYLFGSFGSLRELHPWRRWCEEQMVKYKKSGQHCAENDALKVLYARVINGMQTRRSLMWVGSGQFLLAHVFLAFAFAVADKKLMSLDVRLIVVLVQLTALVITVKCLWDNVRISIRKVETMQSSLELAKENVRTAAKFGSNHADNRKHKHEKGVDGSLLYLFEKKGKVGKAVTMADRAQAALERHASYTCISYLFADLQSNWTDHNGNKTSSARVKSDDQMDAKNKSHELLHKAVEEEAEGNDHLEALFDVEHACIARDKIVDTIRALEISLIEIIDEGFEEGELDELFEHKARKYMDRYLNQSIIYTGLWILNVIAIIALVVVLVLQWRSSQIDYGHDSNDEVMERDNAIPGSMVSDMALTLEGLLIFFCAGKM
jgi:hypothetical protein